MANAAGRLALLYQAGFIDDKSCLRFVDDQGFAQPRATLPAARLMGVETLIASICTQGLLEQKRSFAIGRAGRSGLQAFLARRAFNRTK